VIRDCALRTLILSRLQSGIWNQESRIKNQELTHQNSGRLLALLERLRAFYGVLPSPPSHPFGIYIWEVLSVGTTPARRDAAFNALKRIPALTPDAVARLPQAKLEAAVAHAGAMKDERVRALRAGADALRRNPTLVEELGGSLRRAVKAARRIPHLGRASTLRLVLFSGATPVLPLDEHAFRVAQRLGYGRPADLQVGPTTRRLRVTRQALVAESGREVEVLRALTLYFTHHGLATCTPAAPHCTVCPLAFDCEWLRRQ
jgi:endonuclease III